MEATETTLTMDATASRLVFRARKCAGCIWSWVKRRKESGR